MAHERVTVLTTTYYKTVEETRFKLACGLIAAAKRAGHDCLIVDGSPNPEVLQTLRGLGAVVLQQKVPGIGPSRRQLFQAAGDWHHFEPGSTDPRFATWAPSDAPQIFLWTEPEKVDIIRFIPEIIAPIVRGAADIVIPRRKSLASYPEFQAKTESIADRVYESYMGEGLRPMFGPVAFNRRAAHFFASCNPATKGGHDTYIQHIAPMEARARGFRIVGVEVDFIYPPEQRAEEEAALSSAMMSKRLNQLWECVDNYVRMKSALKLRG